MRVAVRYGAWRALVAALLLILGSAGAALACPVCVTLPERTVADHLLEDEIAVLARPSAEDPFRFEIVEVLRGDPALLPERPPVPFLVDTAARRALAADPQRAIFLSYGPAKLDPQDDPYASPGMSWHRHIVVTPERRAVLEGILQSGDDWYWGADPEDDARFAFFAAHHAHPDPAIRRMALSEIERSSYRLMRGLDIGIPVTELTASLVRLDGIPFAALTILFLGLSESQAAASYVEAGLERSMRITGDSRLSAWITAAVEQDADATLPLIKTRYIDTADRAAPADILSVLTALSVTGNARPELRAEIAPMFYDLAQRAPDFAADVAYALFDWQDWSQGPAFTGLLEAGLIAEHAAQYMLEIYIDTAAEERAQAAH